MPFTLSHAAAALPLHYLLRDALVLPALVIGCFLPDVPYFLPDPLFDINVHLLPGLLWFGLPCGYAFYVVWQRVFLGPCVALLPRRYASLFAMPDPSRRVAWWTIVLSLFAGSLTHIVWDAFTHRRGMVVHAVPMLAHPLVQWSGNTLTPYSLLQHGSTLVGLLWLAQYVRRRSSTAAALGAPRGPVTELPIAQRLLVLAMMMSAAAALVWADFAWTAAPFSAYNVVCRSISSAAIVAAIYALCWQAAQRARQQSRPGMPRRAR